MTIPFGVMMMKLACNVIVDFRHTLIVRQYSSNTFTGATTRVMIIRVKETPIVLSYEICQFTIHRLAQQLVSGTWANYLAPD
jgi:hypothetical protein